LHIALFGGSFNPPHIGHGEVLAWLEALKEKNNSFLFDEVWMLPTHTHAFDKILLDFKQRLELCHLLVEEKEMKRVRVMDTEEKIPGKNRTVDTVNFLKEQYPQNEFTLVLGGDLKNEISSWKNPEELKQSTKFFFIPRKGYLENGQKAIATEISSTDLRQALQKGGKVEKWLTPKVFQYIVGHHLYQKG